ncbi:hypothetical protein CF68_22535 [Cupriavidus sp. SK-4]|uniref:hypothetical protein n=1 Tax=Cupriavidus sp. SK-4 TaxID=574750 RepID=UPI00044E2E55|nr:hypothetical protein [Cupriavidus sp. SK-4]EYS96041.1 hypothetical protein CF68_22535 [Cupriavidus sp. SK-4]
MTRLPRIVLSLTITIAASAQAAKPVLPHLTKGEKYASIRTKMFKAGWVPASTPNADPCATGDKRCEGRTEMEACSGTGMAYCQFLWRKDGQVVSIVTAGEDPRLHNVQVQPN